VKKPAGNIGGQMTSNVQIPSQLLGSIRTLPQFQRFIQVANDLKRVVQLNLFRHSFKPSSLQSLRPSNNKATINLSSKATTNLSNSNNHPLT